MLLHCTDEFVETYTRGPTVRDVALVRVVLNLHGDRYTRHEFAQACVVCGNDYRLLSDTMFQRATRCASNHAATNAYTAENGSKCCWHAMMMMYARGDSEKGGKS